jgi:hypothetical protein
MRLPASFIGRRREGRWYCGGEIVDGKWKGVSSVTEGEKSMRGGS